MKSAIMDLITYSLRNHVMKKIRSLSISAILLFATQAQAANFSTPIKTASMPSRCSQDPLIKTDDANLRISWAFRCGHLDRTEWQTKFPNPENKVLYPVFASTGGSPAVTKPDYGSCALPAAVSFYEVCENGAMIFDGKTRAFGAGQNWDVTDSQVRPLENGRAIRFTLNNEDSWGAAAYVFNSDYSYLKLGRYSRLHLSLKNSGYGAQARILVYLVDMDGQGESIRLPLTIDRSFHDFIVDLDQLSLNGFNTNQSQALVIAVSEPGKQKFEIDLEKISAD